MVFGAQNTLFDRIRLAAASGQLDDPNRNPTKKTIQPVRRDGDSGALADQVADIRTLVNTMAGNVGNSSLLDTAVTVRDLMQGGLLTIEAGDQLLGSGTGMIFSNEGVPVFGGSITGQSLTQIINTVTGIPYMAVPPDPINLRASGTYKHVILTWDLPLYQNHGYTEIWRSATNNLAAAVMIGTAIGQIYVDEASIDLGVQHYYWVREVTNDLTPAFSAFNAGAAGGTVAGAGFINGVDLGPLIITADKLSQGTYPNINLIANPGAEDGVAGWTHYTVAGTTTFTASSADKVSGSASFLIHKSANADNGFSTSTAFPVIPGETYSLKFRARGGTASAAGFSVGFLEKTTKPITIDVNNGNRTSTTTVYANTSLFLAFTPYEVVYVVPAGIYWVSLFFQSFTTSSTTDLYFDDISVGRQITASFLAAGSIAVGTAAIENGAINNAMIANASIDTAQIQNLAVDNSKLANATITNAKIVDATILGAKIGNATIGAANIIDATITTAKIALGAITNALIGDTIQSSGFVAGVSGWRIQKSTGTGEFQNIIARGDVQATSLNAATGTFTGSLTAATGTFAGSLSAATGTFAGALSAATGTFAGTLTAAALKVAGSAIFAPDFKEANTPVAGTHLWQTIGLTTTSINPGTTGKVSISVHIDWVASLYTSGAGAGGGGDT